MAKEKIAKKETEDWMQKKWRPMMAIMYMVVCVFDFIVFPIGFTIVQFWETEASNDAFRQWQPLTLVGAGLFHMAMGAVLGITAWSRGQEKIAGVATNGFNSPTSMPTAYSSPSSGGFGSASGGGYAMQTASYGNYGSSNYSGYETTRETMSVEPIGSGRTFTSKQGKTGPVIEEPEL
jgi:hypothetical protein